MRTRRVLKIERMVGGLGIADLCRVQPSSYFDRLKFRLGRLEKWRKSTLLNKVGLTEAGACSLGWRLPRGGTKQRARGAVVPIVRKSAALNEALTTGDCSWLRQPRL